jgi:hypothetical protein
VADDWDVAELDEQRASFVGWLLDYRTVPGDVGDLARLVDAHPCCVGLQASQLLPHLAREHRGEVDQRAAIRWWRVAVEGWRESGRS